MKKPKSLYAGSGENSVQIAKIQDNDIKIFIIIPYKDQIKRLNKWLLEAAKYIEFLDKKGLR